MAPQVVYSNLVSQASRLNVRMTLEELTNAELTDFDTVERVCSSLSLLGCLFIATTFLTSKAFHKPINRLVFFASMGNIFSNVATLIARAALGNLNSSLCQFQGFLIQMLLPADAYWTLAMAVNVYLTFYWKFDARSLRRLEKYYIMLCYGVPFVPAFVFIWTKSAEKGRMYGNAALWCWISGEWDTLRIYTFYGPVWLVILITIAIYARAGRDIYKRRKQLRSFVGPAPEPEPVPTMGNAFLSSKTTEVFVTSESVESPMDSIDLRDLGRQGPLVQHSGPQPSDNTNHYTVTVSSSQPTIQHQSRPSDEKPYPSHGERNYSVHGVPQITHAPNPPPTRRTAAAEANNAAWGYTKVAGLFFIAMMVTWIPSSANRVYSVVHPNEISLGLEFASAFVLPLQGFWNALIYATTSLPACRQVWAQIRGRKGMSGGGITQIAGVFSGNDGRTSDRKQYIETDSMTELASRPETKCSSR